MSFTDGAATELMKDNTTWCTLRGNELHEAKQVSTQNAE